MFAVANITTMAATRLGFALARGGILPKGMATVAEKGTPRVALTVATLIAAAFVLTGSYLALVATSVALSMVAVVITLASALVLRRREPDLARPFKVPFHPLPVLAALLINAALLVAVIVNDPLHSLEGLAIVVIGGLLLYSLGRKRQPAVAEPEIA